MFKKVKKEIKLNIILLNEVFRNEGFHAFFFIEGENFYFKNEDRIENITEYLKKENINLFKGNDFFISLKNQNLSEKEKYINFIENIFLTFFKFIEKKTENISIEKNYFYKYLLLEEDKIIESIYISGKYIKIKEYLFNEETVIEKHYSGGLISRNYILIWDLEKEFVYYIDEEQDIFLKSYIKIKRAVKIFQKEKKNIY